MPAIWSPPARKRGGKSLAFWAVATALLRDARRFLQGVAALTEGCCSLQQECSGAIKGDGGERGYLVFVRTPPAGKRGG